MKFWWYYYKIKWNLFWQKHYLSLTLASSQASTHSLKTSMGSERKLIFAWKSSKHFVHWTRPVFLSLSIFTSQDFSWLQNGQSKIWSKTSIFRLGGAERFDFRLPIFLWYFGPDIYNKINSKIKLDPLCLVGLLQMAARIRSIVVSNRHFLLNFCPRSRWNTGSHSVAGAGFFSIPMWESASV